MKAIHLVDHISYNMESKIIININSMFRAEVRVYSYIYKTIGKDKFEVDQTDSEIEWYLNDKKVNYKGFKELYNKLYGEKSYNELEKDVRKSAEDKVETRIKTGQSFKEIIISNI